MDDFVSLSVSQVESAEERVMRATGAVRDALAALDAYYDEWVTLQKALQILTRNSERPYVTLVPAHPLSALLEEWQERLGQTGTKDERPAQPKREKAPVPPPPPMPTKVGIIYDAMVAANLPQYEISTILEAIPEDSALPVTREDIYRTLPRLLSRGKVWRDGRGKYHLGPPPEESPASDGFSAYALIKEDEEQPERVPLAS